MKSLHMRIGTVSRMRERYAQTVLTFWITLVNLLTAIGLSHGGSSTVHIYAQTIHRTTQNKQYIEHNNKKNIKMGECGPCPVLASYTLAFALQLRKKQGKTSVRIAASKNTLCAKGKYYFQTYKYPYIYYTTSLSWDSENYEDDFSGSDDNFLGFCDE